jgi:hypothetical protein
MAVEFNKSSRPSQALLQKYLTPDGTTDVPDQLETSVTQNISILLAKISIKDGERGSASTSRRVRHLNDLAKVTIGTVRCAGRLDIGP